MVNHLRTAFEGPFEEILSRFSVSNIGKMPKQCSLYFSLLVLWLRVCEIQLHFGKRSKPESIWTRFVVDRSQHLNNFSLNFRVGGRLCVFDVLYDIEFTICLVNSFFFSFGDGFFELRATDDPDGHRYKHWCPGPSYDSLLISEEAAAEGVKFRGVFFFARFSWFQTRLATQQVHRAYFFIAYVLLMYVWPKYVCKTGQFLERRKTTWQRLLFDCQTGCAWNFCVRTHFVSFNLRTII